MRSASHPRARRRCREAVIVLWFVGCGSEPGAPHLTEVIPDAASRGAMVVLHGESLCGSSGDCTTAAGEIQLGFDPPIVRATIVSYQDTEAQISIPTIAPTGPTQIIASVDDRSSNALAFEVLP